MKALNLITLVLVIIGGINWGLVGVADFNLVAAIFGDRTALTRIIYALAGLSALWQIMPLIAAGRTGEVAAEAHRRAAYHV